MKVCYIIGYPIKHSMSPKMHNSAFRELGLDYRYEAAQVEPGHLVNFLNQVMKRPDVRGASVTIPHKIAVMDELDVIDREAADIGAVNTIVNVKGTLKGYNTDGLGALRVLKESMGDLNDKRVVLLGAGGAARAVAYRIVQEAAAVTILNRTLQRAVELAKYIKEKSMKHNVEVSASPLDDAHLARVVGETDLLINATPVGMHPNVDLTPVPKHILHSQLMVFDLVYNPLRTRLLREAEEEGARTLGGVEMLVYQGAEAFRLWTGREAPLDLMLRVVKGALGG
jgi:shikimate dehydrogenase